MDNELFVPLSTYQEYQPELMRARADQFAQDIGRRRTTRQFGSRLQPWHFVVILEPNLKARIREAAETSEREFYATGPQEWLEVLAPLGTDASKPYLETAPYLIAVFAQRYGLNPDGSQRKHYYVNESVGIATGFLIAALHHAGLATLTHTPNPMAFLTDLLERPVSEKPTMLVITGYPASDARIPNLVRKPLAEIATFR